MFHNREDAATQLAATLKGREFRDPIVLAIPRGGVVIGAILARELGAHLDVVLARKLRAPGQAELAIGAIAETGEVFLNPDVEGVIDLSDDYLSKERQYQLAEIARRKEMLGKTRPRAPVADRSVIVTDDGIATGSTMIAALRVIQAKHPFEIIVAVPVASPERLDELRPWCNEIVCLQAPQHFWSIGQFYEDFTQVDDEQVMNLLRRPARASRAANT